jgi:capsular polysaccharide biosynthesis protein
MAENDIDTIDVLMDSIDAGEKRIQQVDWTDFCITCVQIYAHSNGVVRIGIAIHQYLCRLHIIDYRIDILNIILQHQSLYTKDIPLTDNGAKNFQQECLNLIYFYQLLRTLTISNHTVYEYLKQYRSKKIYFSYEFTAMLKFMTPDIFFTFALFFFFLTKYGKS